MSSMSIASPLRSNHHNHSRNQEEDEDMKNGNDVSASSISFTFQGATSPTGKRVGLGSSSMQITLYSI